MTLLAPLSQAEVLPPSWAGEANAVRHLYLFSIESEKPSPDEEANPFDSSVAIVWPNYPTASGWLHDDDNPGHYFWDLGSNGTIRVAVPIGDMASTPGFDGYDIQIQVNAVAYPFFMFQMPSLSEEGYALQDVAVTNTTAYGSGLDEWRNRTWTAQIESVMEDAITLVVTSAAGGSRVESLEIHALAVPRPLELTPRGTPFSWFRGFGLEPEPNQDWEDVDDDDADNDGMLNWQEYVAGTCPTNSTSLLKVVTLRIAADETPAIEWIGGTNGPGMDYVIECTSNLDEPDWRPVGTHPRTEGINTWSGEVPLEGARFFRIRATTD